MAELGREHGPAVARDAVHGRRKGEHRAPVRQGEKVPAGWRSLRGQRLDQPHFGAGRVLAGVACAGGGRGEDWHPAVATATATVVSAAVTKIPGKPALDVAIA